MISRRGLFGVLAGAAAVPVVNVPEAAEATTFPQEGVELASMKWFNRGRGFGILRGLESGHDIFIARKVLEGIDEKQVSSLRFLVSCKMRARGPVAEEIRDVRPWTREEREKEVQKWIERQEGFA